MKKLSALALTFLVLTLGAPVLTRSQPRQSSQQDEKKPELVNITFQSLRVKDIPGFPRVICDKCDFVAVGPHRALITSS